MKSFGSNSLSSALSRVQSGLLCPQKTYSTRGFEPHSHSSPLSLESLSRRGRRGDRSEDRGHRVGLPGGRGGHRVGLPIAAWVAPAEAAAAASSGPVAVPVAAAVTAAAVGRQRRRRAAAAAAHARDGGRCRHPRRSIGP